MVTDFKITTRCFYLVAFIISLVVIIWPPINTFNYDIFGYYIYLPLSLKYHDITIQNYSIITDTLNQYHASETFYQAVKWDNGNWVMRYPIGLAVLFSPFYFIADIVVKSTDYPADGFSRPYQLSVIYGCLLYSILGLYFIKKTLTLLFNDKTAAITLICISLGTNYFFHSAFHAQGAMSHNLLFSLYALIIYLTIKWHRSYEFKYIIGLGISVGLAALCRPSEIICVLIPLFYNIYSLARIKSKLQLLYKYRIQIIVFILIIICIGFLQFGYWKHVTGNFIVNPYGKGNPGEGLEPLHPHVLEVLFSFRKGWLIYTPLMIFTIAGFWFMYKANKIISLSVFFYFILNFYIVSCWSCWWYGACFGVRSLIPSYAVLCIPLGYFIFYIINNRMKYFYLFFIVMCIGLNLFQSWQLNAGIIDSTNMSRAYYLSTFLQTSTPTSDQKKLLLKGKFNSGIELFTKDDSLTHSLAYAELINFEEKNEHVIPLFLCDTLKHSSKHGYLTNPNNPDSPAIEIMYKNISSKAYTWIKASIWVYSVYPADSIDAFLSIELKHRGLTFKYTNRSLNTFNFKPNQWNKLEYYYLTPDDLRSTKDEVKTFFTNRSKYPIYVDDLLLESYEPIINPSVF